jgi:hypothetical protein
MPSQGAPRIQRVVLLLEIDALHCIVFKDTARRCGPGSNHVDIVHEIDIATSPERLYEALTTQAGLSGWYIPETTAAADVGAMIEFKFSTLTTLKLLLETGTGDPFGSPASIACGTTPAGVF